MRLLKFLLFPAFIFYSHKITAQTQDSTKHLSLSGNIQLTNDGFSPVPVFSLGRPAILATAVIKKGHFYFNPEFDFGMDFRPWTINSRFG